MNPFLAAEHQDYLDRLGALDYALEKEIKEVTRLADEEDDDVILEISEWLCDNSEEQILHDLAFGSGAFDKLTEQRERAIAAVAEQRLINRLED